MYLASMQIEKPKPGGFDDCDTRSMNEFPLRDASEREIVEWRDGQARLHCRHRIIIGYGRVWMSHMRYRLSECCSGVDEPVSRLAGYAFILQHSSFAHVVLTLGRCPLQRGSCHDPHQTTGGPMTSPFSRPSLRRLLLLLLFLLLLLLLLLGASSLDAPCAISTASPTAIPQRSR